MNFFRKYQRILYFSLIFLLGVFFIYILSIALSPSTPVDNSQNNSNKTVNGDFPTAGNRDRSTSSISDNIDLPSANNRKASEIANGDLTMTEQISTSSVNSIAIDRTSNGLKYYDKDTGRFYKIDQNGQKISMSDKIFFNASNVIWSKISDTAIIEYPDNSNIIYNFTTQKQTTMPKHWQDFEFSPANDQIVTKSIGLDPNNRWLAITNADGTNEQILEALGEKENTVRTSWSPNDRVVALQVEGRSLNRQEVYFIGKNNENFKSTTVEGRDFRSQWAPDGSNLLYSVYSSDNDFKPKLWAVSANGDTIGEKRIDLGVETWSDKCVFSSATEAYCAVPQNLPAGAGITPEIAAKIPDSIYRIDITNGQKRLVAIPDGSFNINNIAISPNAKSLFFTDRNDQRIYKIKLK